MSRRSYILAIVTLCVVAVAGGVVYVRLQENKTIGLLHTLPPWEVNDPDLGIVYFGQMFVEFTPTATPEEISGAVDAVRGSVLKTYYSPLTLQLQLPTTTNTTELKHALILLPSYPGVESVYPYSTAQLFSNGAD